MIPSQTFPNYPEFANSGTKTQPGAVKYAAGFVSSDTLPAEWLNWFLAGATKGVSALNSGLSSVEEELNNILSAYNITADATETEQVLTALLKLRFQTAACTSQAGADTKAINITGTLRQGDLIGITFTNANSYGDGVNTYPKLSINGGASYPMKNQSGRYLRAGSWADGDYVEVRFLGDSFICRTPAWEDVYPVGAIYKSTVATSPSTLFGGTWEQIKDSFLLSAGDTYTAGDTGGSATATLAVGNLPSHTHTLNNGNTSSAGTTKTAGFRGVSSTTGGMSANSTGSFVADCIETSSWSSVSGFVSRTYLSKYDLGNAASGNTLSKFSMNISHTHTVTASGYLYGRTDKTGSGTAFSIMPPYLVVYVWKRTA